MTDEQVQMSACWHASKNRSHLSSQALKGEYFDKNYSDIITCLRRMLASGNEPSLRGVALSNSVDGDTAKLALAIDAITTPGVGFGTCTEYLRDRFLRLKLREACQTGFESTWDKSKPIGQTISAVASKALAITRTDCSSIVPAANFASVNRDIQFINANPGKLMGYSSGFRSLDRLINGITPRFYVIGGRPSSGKTALEGDIIASLCEQGVGCLEMSLEMSADEKRKRYLAKLSGVSLSTYRQSAFSQTELQMIKRAQDQMSKWRHWIDDTPGCSIEDIEVKVTMMVQNEGIGAVSVDYIQLVTSPGYRDRFAAVSDVSTRLKDLSRRLNIPVIALAQLRRADSRYDAQLKHTVIPKPKLDDFRESGNIEQDADVAALLHRDHVFSPDQAELVVAKQRSGPTHEGILMSYSSGAVTFREKSI